MENVMKTLINCIQMQSSSMGLLAWPLTESSAKTLVATVGTILAAAHVTSQAGPRGARLVGRYVPWAKQGLVEDPSLVTETMAKLYAQQGQMGRARKAYKLLALKYPEKSVYFAAQLKKLRNT